MNNLTGEEEINYIATDILAKVFFPLMLQLSCFSCIYM